MKGAEGYPANWSALSEALKNAAERRCEHCGVNHGEWGWRDDRGAFHGVARRPNVRPPFTLMDGEGIPRRIIEIVLAAAHLDRRLDRHEWDRLVVLCQRCHLLHDLPQHRRNAAATRRAAMATRELFETLPGPAAASSPSRAGR